MKVQAQEDWERGACSGKGGWLERGSPIQGESKLCCREIPRLGADLTVGLMPVKFYLRDLKPFSSVGLGIRHIRNEDTVDLHFPKWTLDSHLKNLNVYVFSCILENKYRLSNPLVYAYIILG